jgi:hypothetical protein
MKTNYHQPLGFPRPRRGDLLQTNPGDRRERTMIVIGARDLKTRWCKEMELTAQRTRVWAERWWEIEPETRMALYRSAERHGGQLVHTFKRFPAKRKPTFEKYMRQETSK